MRKKLVVAFAILTIIILLVVIVHYKSIYAFLIEDDKVTNVFKVGKLSATVTEPNYENNKIIKPGEEITKDPTLSNTGEVDSYIRAQVYVPISKEIKYVDTNENIITPSEEIEILNYQVNEGWEEVTEEGFFGTYEDNNERKYKVYTYKYVENGAEKVVKPGETIEKTLFDKVKVINYLDVDKTTNLKLHISAIAVQVEDKPAEESWTYYKNQKGTGIVGVE